MTNQNWSTVYGNLNYTSTLQVFLFVAIDPDKKEHLKFNEQEQLSLTQ